MGRISAFQTGFAFRSFFPAIFSVEFSCSLFAGDRIGGGSALAQVESRKASGSFRNYADSFSYTAAGAVASMRLGNGRWENTTFNSRLQPVQIGLGYSAQNQGLLRLNYNYGAADNNGNIKSQTITVPTIGAITGFTAVQNYSYDSLNRIKDAAETIGANETWRQTFVYDRFGNRNFEAANTSTLPKECGTAPNLTVCEDVRKMMNPNINPANNRLSTTDGYLYDTAGNTTRDSQNRRFTYDAENKQTKVEQLDSNGGVTAVLGHYFYDGDGKRVKKIVPGTGEVKWTPLSRHENALFKVELGGRFIA